MNIIKHNQRTTNDKSMASGRLANGWAAQSIWFVSIVSKNSYPDAKLTLLLKDELEFTESIKLNYNLICLHFIEYNQFYEQLLNVLHIAVSARQSVLMIAWLLCSELLGLNDLIWIHSWHLLVVSLVSTKGVLTNSFSYHFRSLQG